MKTTITENKSLCPHVKWGALAGTIATLLIALSLIVLNFMKVSLSSFVFNAIIAYGPIIAFFLFIISSILLLEDFVPSILKYKNYKRKMSYIREVNANIRESVRSNSRHDSIIFNDFLNENPKYKV